MKKLNNNLDLIIIDIDNTFIYHRTVAIANKIYLKKLHELFQKKFNENKLYTTKESIKEAFKLLNTNFFKFKPKNKLKKLLKLTYRAFQLYKLEQLRIFNNKFFKTISNKKTINKWIKTVIENKLEEKDIQIPKEIIRKNLNQTVTKVYEQLREKNPKAKIVAITQHFNVNKDFIKEILNIDNIQSNKFKTNKQGIITDYELNIKNKEDKKRIAEKIIKKYKSKNIGLFIEDYDDIELIKLKGVKFIMYKKKLRRFIKNKNIKTIMFN